MTARLAPLVIGLLAVAAITATARHQDVPEYVWNLTPSVPRGLYAVEPPRSLRVTTLVVVRPPPPLASLLDRDGYLPRPCGPETRQRRRLSPVRTILR